MKNKAINRLLESFSTIKQNINENYVLFKIKSIKSEMHIGNVKLSLQVNYFLQLIKKIRAFIFFFKKKKFLSFMISS